mmetsp:Transcript_42242/g.103528  ORF Transcript_42242/g.103528 Transcript_42242/m.103528 type:complete len:245 (+) Transcript_42242:348-1082(+)
MSELLRGNGILEVFSWVPSCHCSDQPVQHGALSGVKVLAFLEPRAGRLPLPQDTDLAPWENFEHLRLAAQDALAQAHINAPHSSIANLIRARRLGGVPDHHPFHVARQHAQHLLQVSARGSVGVDHVLALEGVLAGPERPVLPIRPSWLRNSWLTRHPLCHLVVHGVQARLPAAPFEVLGEEASMHEDGVSYHKHRPALLGQHLPRKQPPTPQRQVPGHCPRRHRTLSDVLGANGIVLLAFERT